MKYFAALLRMKDPDKNAQYRQQHVDFLLQREQEGWIFARGRFADNTGGLVVYVAPTLEAAAKIAESDPYVVTGARSLELHEWEMQAKA